MDNPLFSFEYRYICKQNGSYPPQPDVVLSVDIVHNGRWEIGSDDWKDLQKSAMGSIPIDVCRLA